MLPDAAFLRKLPKVLDQGQRLRMEALVFASDTIELSLDEFYSIAWAHRDRETEFSRASRIKLFNLAWTIVDDFHVARQILQTLPFDDDLTRSFLTVSAPAHALRNKMDHLNQNVENLVSSKAARPPVFGVLSYFCANSEDPKNVDGGNIVTVMAGAFSHKVHAAIMNPAGKDLRLPVGGLQLEAFSDTLAIEQAAARLDEVVEKVNRHCQAEFAEQAEQLATEHSISLSELTDNFAEGLVVSMRIKFGRPDSTEPTPP